MKFKIIWLENAEIQLDNIFDYYIRKVDYKKATEIVGELSKAPLKLLLAPYICQKENILKDREIVYRYLVCNNYKIIYFIDENKGLISITDVFHTKQNPSKINRTP